MNNNKNKTDRRCDDNTITYVVKQGDSLYKIATRNKTTIEMLLELNPELNANLLIPGIVMCVPVHTNPAFAPNKKNTKTQASKPISVPDSNVPKREIPTAKTPVNYTNKNNMFKSVAYQAMQKNKCNNDMKYTVLSGDTLYNIAKKYGITLYELLNANKDINPYNIVPGQIICVPIPDEKCPFGTAYTVTAEDTLTEILLKFKIPISTLLENNPELDPYDIEEGMQICVPAFSPFRECDSGRTYIIREGDSLMSISEMFSISVESLLVTNPYMMPEDFSKRGVEICLPESAK